MDKLILENQIAIMQALDQVLFHLESRDEPIGDRRENLWARVTATKAALETCRPEGSR